MMIRVEIIFFLEWGKESGVGWGGGGGGCREPSEKGG